MRETQISASEGRSEKNQGKPACLDWTAESHPLEKASATQKQDKHQPAVHKPEVHKQDSSVKQILGDFAISGTEGRTTKAPQVKLSVKAELLSAQPKSSDKAPDAENRTGKDKTENKNDKAENKNNDQNKNDISKRSAQLDSAAEKILNGANERFGKSKIDELKIKKGDVGAATTALLLGPDVCKMMGPEKTSLLGKQLIVFGVAPMFGMADEAKKQISTNAGGVLHEGSGNFITGTAIGAILEKAHPAVLWTTVLGAGAWIANDQLNSPEHKARNKELQEINSRLASCSNSELLQFADHTKKVLGPECYKGAFTLATGGAGLPEGKVLAAGAKEEAKGLLNQVKFNSMLDGLKTLGKEGWESLSLLANSSHTPFGGAKKECFALATGVGIGRGGGFERGGDSIITLFSKEVKNLENSILKMAGKGKEELVEAGSKLSSKNAGDKGVLNSATKETIEKGIGETFEGTIKGLANELAALEKKPFANKCESLERINESLLKLQKTEIPARGQANQLAKIEDDFLKQVEALEKDTAALKSKAKEIEAKHQQSEAEEALLERYYAQEDAMYKIVTERLKTKYGWDGTRAGMQDLSISLKSGIGSQREVSNTISKTLNEGLEKNPIVQRILKQKGIDPERAKGWLGIASDMGSAADNAGCDYLLVNKNTGEMYAIDVTERAANLGAGKLYDSKLTRPDLIFQGKSIPRERVDTVIAVADDVAADNIAFKASKNLKPLEAEKMIADLKEQQIAEIIAETISRPSRLNILHSELPSGSASTPSSKSIYEMWRFRSALEKIGYTEWAQAVTSAMGYLRSQNKSLPYY